MIILKKMFCYFMIVCVYVWFYILLLLVILYGVWSCQLNFKIQCK